MDKDEFLSEVRKVIIEKRKIGDDCFTIVLKKGGFLHLTEIEVINNGWLKDWVYLSKGKELLIGVIPLKAIKMVI